ncbi:PREDICTED: sodium/hydrogen exchanger 3-like [Camelina sativa]|uniref:Sodium/hydrogen exchanger 3-like n=1 Tax=Camelina sativa TaxID=90675 RepID=A0ABM1QK32_CAMSA|nr:PREDICTED: sodium/hydrogen exchanger 3-like [Camelina sativa]
MKNLYIGRHSTDPEVALMMLLAYLSYMLAELFHLSSILTVIFCGIVMCHYTWHSVTDKSKVTTKHTFAALSFLAEIFIFLYVGMDALDIEKWDVVPDRWHLLRMGGSSVSGDKTTYVIVGKAQLVQCLEYLLNAN